MADDYLGRPRMLDKTRRRCGWAGPKIPTALEVFKGMYFRVETLCAAARPLSFPHVAHDGVVLLGLSRGRFECHAVL